MLTGSSGEGGGGVAWVARGKVKVLTVKHGWWWVVVRASAQRQKRVKKMRGGRERGSHGGWKRKDK